MRIQFFVPGQARPAGSKSAFKNPRTGKIIVTHQNPKTKDWMDSVKWHAMKNVGRMCLLTDAVCLKLTFLRQRPAAHYGSGRNAGKLKGSAPPHNTKMPDRTKLIRCVEDALTGIIWRDDSQVMTGGSNKRYCRGSERPGVWVLIEPVDQNSTLPDYGMEGLTDEQKGTVQDYGKEEEGSTKEHGAHSVRGRAGLFDGGRA